LFERLGKEKYLVLWAKTIREAKIELNDQKFNLIILDLGLPDGSGFDLAKEIRRTSSSPIVFMTAMNSAENRLEGYEIGAEEFIPKPFHLKELLMRIQRILANKKEEEMLFVNGKTIQFSAQMLIHQDGREELIPKRDFDLLKILIANSPKVLSRDEILDQLWGEDKFPSHRTVDNTIVRLRQVLGDSNAELIRSVRGVGYQWFLKSEKEKNE
jgi:DNA-binding response OmpR family regulator